MEMAKKSKRADENRMMSKYTLIHVYKEFLREPLKTFVLRDFSMIANATKKFREKYLNTLIALDIIKKVHGVYYTEDKKITRRDCIGYRLNLERHKSYEGKGE